MSAVLIEYTVMDDMVRVAAIDEATGTEAILIGPVSAGRTALKQAAIQKLEYVLAKQARTAPTQRRPGYWA